MKLTVAKIAVVVGVLLVVVYFGRGSEMGTEFDTANLRLRWFERSTIWEIPVWSHYADPEDHPTAKRLRELGVIPPIDEAAVKWVLIKGFKTGARGWKGAGREYLKALGATSFGTPLPFPANEDLEENVWVKWALLDPEGAQKFWQQATTLTAQKPWPGAYYLMAASEYLEEKKFQVKADEVLAHAQKSLDQ